MLPGPTRDSRWLASPLRSEMDVPSQSSRWWATAAGRLCATRWTKEDSFEGVCGWAPLRGAQLRVDAHRLGGRVQLVPGRVEGLVDLPDDALAGLVLAPSGAHRHREGPELGLGANQRAPHLG